MQTLLIVSKNKEKTNERLMSLCRENKVDKIDLHINNFEKALGIEDVRNFQKKLFLKPISSPIKVVYLEAYEGITIEAQNALLKIFEEPPNSTLIALSLPNKDFVLPTILSRCKIIKLEEKNHELSNDETAEFLSVFTSLPTKPIEEKLKFAQDITKNKEEVLWIEKMILFLRSKLIKSIEDNKEHILSQYFNVLISMIKAHALLKTTNANPRLTLENLFLSLS